MGNNKIALIVPTLDEIKGVKAILPLINKKWYSQLIILDGGSTDGTVEWCRHNGYEVYRQKAKGVWNAYRELFFSHLIDDCDVVVTFSPDGNSVPEAIPKLTRKIIEEGYDMVIGSRYRADAVSEDDTWLTAFGNKVLTWLCNQFTGARYTDALVMLRAYRKNIVYKLGFMKDLSPFQKVLVRLSNLYGWESSMSIRAAKKGLKIGEIPVPEPKALRERRQNTFVHGLVLISQIIHEGGLR